MYGSPEFYFEAGEFCVYDIEHLFGRDLVLAKFNPAGYPVPVAIVSHHDRMDFLDQGWALRWAMAADRDDWALASHFSEVLSTKLM